MYIYICNTMKDSLKELREVRLFTQCLTFPVSGFIKSFLC